MILFSYNERRMGVIITVRRVTRTTEANNGPFMIPFSYPIERRTNSKAPLPPIAIPINPDCFLSRCDNLAPKPHPINFPARAPRVRRNTMIPISKVIPNFDNTSPSVKPTYPKKRGVKRA